MTFIATVFHQLNTEDDLAAMRLAQLVVLIGAGVLPSIAWSGPPFRTDDPEPVEYGHWEIYGFSTGTAVHGDTAGVFPALEVNYGAAPNVQLHVILPLAFDRQPGLHTRVGLGDTELGVKYRFIQEDEHGVCPQIGTFPFIEVPTGDANRNLGAGHTRVFLPLWAQKTVGAWTSYGGAGYWINPGADNRNYWYLGWLLQRKLTEQLVLGGELFHQTQETRNGRDSTAFNFGGIFDFTEHHHLLFSAGRGIQGIAATNEFSYYLALQWTY